MEQKQKPLTQCDRVYKYIEQFGSITSLDAFRDIGCCHLSSRICDLKQQGKPIKSEMISSKNRYGETIYYKKYYLEKSTPQIRSTS